jgi:hypothetical protein
LRTLPLAALLLLLSACSERDLCAETPLCEEGRAINCESACTVGPCSNGPQFQTCGEGESCTVVLGDQETQRFRRSRAVCAQGEATCEPATAGPPTCDSEGNVTGCSAYKRTIRVACAQSGLFFENAACCRGIVPPNTSTDGGTSGTDGGTSGTDGGR